MPPFKSLGGLGCPEQPLHCQIPESELTWEILFYFRTTGLSLLRAFDHFRERKQWVTSPTLVYTHYQH